MSKKTKRQARNTASTAATAAPKSNNQPVTFASAGTRVYDREFNPDYTLVVKDLKRVGILASSFVAILVILSFFLR